MFILIIQMKRRPSTRDYFSGEKNKVRIKCHMDVKKKCVSVGERFSHQGVGQLNASISHTSVEE